MHSLKSLTLCVICVAFLTACGGKGKPRGHDGGEDAGPDGEVTGMDGSVDSAVPADASTDAGLLPILDAGVMDEVVGDALADGDCDGEDSDGDGAIDEGACTYAVRTFKGHGYFFATESLLWEQAKAKCQAVGYHLATIQSAAENKWIGDIATPNGDETGWWIGAVRPEHNPTYAWITGEKWKYTNWWAGKPDNLNGTDLNILDIERCVEIGYSIGVSPRRHGYWNDAPCLGTLGAAVTLRRYVCESN